MKDIQELPQILSGLRVLISEKYGHGEVRKLHVPITLRRGSVSLTHSRLTCYSHVALTKGVQKSVVDTGVDERGVASHGPTTHANSMRALRGNIKYTISPLYK